MRNIPEIVVGTCIIGREREKKFVYVPTCWFQVFSVCCIVMEWIGSTSVNLILNQDHVAIGLNEYIDEISGIGSFFAVYLKIAAYRLSPTCNTANLSESV